MEPVTRCVIAGTCLKVEHTQKNPASFILCVYTGILNWNDFRHIGQMTNLFLHTLQDAKISNFTVDFDVCFTSYCVEKFYHTVASEQTNSVKIN